MTAAASSASKVRLVVGLLGGAGELSAALAELAAARLQPRQIRLVAPADVLQGAGAGWPAAPEGFGAWIVCRPAAGRRPWSLSLADGRSAETAADRIVMQDVRALLELHRQLHQWALRRQAERLDRHLRGGGALLLVAPATDTEERAACTALLRHASGGVQTHEIARVPAGGPA